MLNLESVADQFSMEERTVVGLIIRVFIEQLVARILAVVIGAIL